MATGESLHGKLLALLLAGLVASAAVGTNRALARKPETRDFRADFLELADLAAEQLNHEPRKPPRHKAFYVDSYVVRALAIAYDLTGEQKYLDPCKRWSDRMLDCQNRMNPRGAYYMNYGRKPGEDKGGWYVADSACIGMGVLATAVRCRDKAEKDRYLDSVERFAKLVMDNYVGPAGGITDGLWEKYDGEWWCSSGTFCSLAFLLYKETDDAQYLEVAYGALDWLNRLDFHKVKHISFEDAAPSVVMYVFEGHSASMPYLKEGTERREATVAQIAKAAAWMARNQKSRQPAAKWDYHSQWGSKLGGLPFQMLVYARHVPEFRELRPAAEAELAHVSSVLFAGGDPKLSQLAAFALISYAEMVRPGALFRPSEP